MKVKNPKNILQYETKLIMGLTKRQIIALVIGVALMVVSTVLFNSFLGYEVGLLIGAVCAAIAMMCGTIKVSGLYFEKIIVRIIKSLMGKDVRKYRKENIYGKSKG